MNERKSTEETEESSLLKEKQKLMARQSPKQESREISGADEPQQRQHLLNTLSVSTTHCLYPQTLSPKVATQIFSVLRKW